MVKPFPWYCSRCGKAAVEPLFTNYTTEILDDNILYDLEIPNLEIPTCKVCGEKSFGLETDRQINLAFQEKLMKMSKIPEMYKVRFKNGRFVTIADLTLSCKEEENLCEISASALLHGAKKQLASLINTIKKQYRNIFLPEPELEIVVLNHKNEEIF